MGISPDAKVAMGISPDAKVATHINEKNPQGIPMKNLINLTPHSVTIYGADGIVEVPPSGQLCRVKSSQEPDGRIAGVPVFRQRFDAIEGLPEPVQGHVYIVSSLVLRALAESGAPRSDVIAPGTGPQDGCIRDPQGRVVGVTRFLRAC